MGARAVPTTAQTEVTPASAVVGAMSVPDTDAQSIRGKTGPVLSVGLQQTLVIYFLTKVQK